MPQGVSTDWTKAAVLPIWTAMFGYARSHGIGGMDAEDLASNAFERAFRAYNPERGKFEALCFKTLRNLMVDYWKKRDLFGRAVVEEPRDTSIRSPLRQIIDLEHEGELRSLYQILLRNLSDQDKEYLHAYGRELEERPRGARSRAARSIGVHPLKGNDIFRRVSRKSERLIKKRFDAVTSDSRIDFMAARLPRGGSAGFPAVTASHARRVRRLARLYALSRAFDRFWRGLAPKLKRGLRSSLER